MKKILNAMNSALSGVVKFVMSMFMAIGFLLVLLVLAIIF